ASISPGMSVLPVASITATSSDSGTAARSASASPMRWMNISLTSTDWRGTGGAPVPSMRLALVISNQEGTGSVSCTLRPVMLSHARTGRPRRDHASSSIGWWAERGGYAYHILHLTCQIRYLVPDAHELGHSRRSRAAGTHRLRAAQPYPGGA